MLLLPGIAFPKTLKEFQCQVLYFLRWWKACVVRFALRKVSDAKCCICLSFGASERPRDRESRSAYLVLIQNWCKNPAWLPSSSCVCFLFNSYSKLMAHALLAALPRPPSVDSPSILIQNVNKILFFQNICLKYSIIVQYWWKSCLAPPASSSVHFSWNIDEHFMLAASSGSVYLWSKLRRTHDS